VVRASTSHHARALAMAATYATIVFSLLLVFSLVYRRLTREQA